MKTGVPNHLKPYLEIENEVIDENEEFTVKGKVRCTCGCDTFTIYREKWVLSPIAKEAGEKIQELYKKYREDPKLKKGLVTQFEKNKVYIVYKNYELRETIYLEDITELEEKADTPLLPTYVEAVCSHCGKSIIVFDSSKHGYNSIVGKGIFKYAESFPVRKKRRCRNCKEETTKIVVTLSNTGKTDLFTEVDDRSIINDENWENAFDWITIDLECGKCGKQTKKYIHMETM